MRIKVRTRLALAILAVLAACSVPLAAPPPLSPQTTVVRDSFQAVKRLKPAVVAAAARTDRILVSWRRSEDASSYKIYRDGVFIAQAQKHTPMDGYFTADEWSVVLKALGINNKSQYNATGKAGEIEREEIREILAQLYAGAARAMGLGYLDTAVQGGKTYKYQVKKVANGQEVNLGGQIEVTARDYRQDMAMPAAGQCLVVEGDQRIGLYWPISDKIPAYDLYRDGKKLNDLPFAAVGYKPAPASPNTAPGQYYINPAPLTPKEKVHAFVDGTKLEQDKIDKRKINVLEELSYGTHQYKLIPRDQLGPGPQSLTLAGASKDLYPPAAPAPLVFEPAEDEWTLPAAQHTGCCVTCPLCKGNWTPPAPGKKYKYQNGLRIAWDHVRWNTEGLPEKVASYKVFRYDSVQAANNDKNGTGTGGTPVGAVTVPASPGQFFATAVTDKTALPDRVYWYRVFVWDRAGRLTGSGPFSASYRDDRPPLAPDFVMYESSKETSITIRWKPSADADLAGYRIYRRVCGTKPVQVPYNGAPAASLGAVSVVPSWIDDQFRLIKTMPVEKTLTPAQTTSASQKTFGQPQAGSQTTLQQTQPQNQATGLQGFLSYTDSSLPEMSPLCYEYVVRAYDRSQNASIDTRGNITCGRMKDTKGPAAPTITNLKARGNSIRIEWVAPPTPDLYTFRVLRSEDGAAWTKVSVDPSFPPQAGCEDVPPEGRDWVLGLGPGMHEGIDGNGQPLKNAYWFEDSKGIKANAKYHYRVVAVDYNKNPVEGGEAGSVSAVSSTFTYEKYSLAAPSLALPVFDPLRGVVLAWTPPAGVQNVTYIIYRSAKGSASGFQPVAAGLTKASFTDATARPGVMYWYKVQYVTAAGHYSEYSNVVTIKPPE